MYTRLDYIVDEAIEAFRKIHKQRCREFITLFLSFKKKKSEYQRIVDKYNHCIQPLKEFAEAFNSISDDDTFTDQQIDQCQESADELCRNVMGLITVLVNFTEWKTARLEQADAYLTSFIFMYLYSDTLSVERVQVEYNNILPNGKKNQRDFVIINRAPASDIYDPTTWGENAVIIHSDGVSHKSNEIPDNSFLKCLQWPDSMSVASNRALNLKLVVPKALEQKMGGLKINLLNNIAHLQDEIIACQTISGKAFQATSFGAQAAEPLPSLSPETQMINRPLPSFFVGTPISIANKPKVDEKLFPFSSPKTQMADKPFASFFVEAPILISNKP